jgi:hypothetical protein
MDTHAMSDTDLPPLPTLPVGRYRHYKQLDYEVIGVVRHSETLEPLVLYRALYGEQGLWVRPFAMFTEEVWVDGVSVPRFRELSDPA